MPDAHIPTSGLPHSGQSLSPSSGAVIHDIRFSRESDFNFGGDDQASPDTPHAEDATCTCSCACTCACDCGCGCGCNCNCVCDCGFYCTPSLSTAINQVNNTNIDAAVENTVYTAISGMGATENTFKPFMSLEAKNRVVARSDNSKRIFNAVSMGRNHAS